MGSLAVIAVSRVNRQLSLITAVKPSRCCFINESKMDRTGNLPGLVLRHQTKLRRADTHHLLVRTEEVSPEQQDWSSSLDQEDPPEPPHIKEEQEEIWTKVPSW
ncbi:hypothetical protein INR49_007145 [Caranx melampygus]|nr:hypothetical protein INR49_007145 [Caranx melampygus]